MSYSKEQRCRDCRIVFSSEEGERVLGWLIDSNGILKANFSTDPYVHAFNEGRRNAVLDILSMMNAEPKDFRDLARLAQEAPDE